MRKRIFSLLLALCLVAGMLPTVAYAVPEGNPLTKNFLDNTYKITELGSEVYKLKGGKFHLLENISVDTVIYIGDYNNSANVTLDLNGYELKSENTSVIFNLRNSSTLTLIDSSSEKTGKIISSSGTAIYLDYKCKLNANGGTVEGKVALYGNNATIDNTDLSNITVFREGQIYGNDSSAVINGGIFYGTVNGYSGKITGGTFYGAVNSGTIEDSAKVTVTFDSDGGSTVDAQKVLRGQKATEPTAPTKQNCTFEGWYNGDTLYDFSIPVTENITLTAKWSFSRIMLTKDILESTYKVISQFGNYYSLPSGNYYLSEDISVDKVIYIGTYTTLTQNVVLDLNGFELKNDTNSAVVLCPRLNSTLTLTDNSSDKTGTVTSNSDRAVKISDTSTLNANGGTVKGEIENNAVIDNTDQSNVTVFEGPVSNYGGTIKGGIFNSNVSIQSGSITGGTFYGEVINKNTVTGGTFYGEVTNNGTITGGTFYGEVTSNRVITGGTFYGTITGSGTLSGATYRRIVTFDSNGGSEVPSQDIIKDSTATEPTAPTKADCTFEGWYNGDALYNFNTPVTENIALTAKWSEKPGIIFNTNPQSYSYDGSAQAFSITGTAVTGFDISYKKSGHTVASPTDAGSYDVIIKRAEDNTYKTVNETITNGLVINPATPTESLAKKTTARVGRGRTLGDATVTNGEILALDGVTPLTGTFAWVDSTKTMSEDGTEQMVFTPDDTNYAPITIDVAVSTYTHSTPTYSPAVVQPEIGGTIEVSPANPKKGATVTITPKPDAGYKVEKVVVTANGVPIEVTLGEDGTYSFIQPAGKVTIELVYAEEQAAELPFKDVPKEAYYYDAVKWAAENGITGGTSETTFSPEDPCTRAQIVTFLWIAADCPEPASLAGLLDVSADAYYAKAVAWALEQGITSGTGDGKFNPDAVCSRAQAMTFIYLNEVAKGGGMKGAWMFLNPFTDVELGSYYGEAVMWALANGITSGTSDTTFSPDASCTRAQIVTFLYGALAGK